MKRLILTILISLALVTPALANMSVDFDSLTVGIVDTNDVSSPTLAELNTATVGGSWTFVGVTNGQGYIDADAGGSDQALRISPLQITTPASTRGGWVTLDEPVALYRFAEGGYLEVKFTTATKASTGFTRDKFWCIGDGGTQHIKMEMDDGHIHVQTTNHVDVGQVTDSADHYSVSPWDSTAGPVGAWDVIFDVTVKIYGDGSVDVAWDGRSGTSSVSTNLPAGSVSVGATISGIACGYSASQWKPDGIYFSQMSVTSYYEFENHVPVVIGGKPLVVGGKAIVSTIAGLTTDPDLGKVAWSPADIDTEGWWDAGDPATITEAGGKVSQLDDKSGNDQHLTQPFGTFQPNTGTYELNGLNMFWYDGDALATYGNDFVVPADGNFSVFQVSEVFLDLSNVADGMFSMLNAGGLDWQFGGGVNVTSFNGRLVVNELGGTTMNFATPMGIGGAIYNIVFDYTSGTIDGYLSGVIRPGTTYTSKVTTPQTFIVNSNRAGNALRGHTGETIIINDVSEETRQKIEGYLAWKWNFVSQLPSDHPYKTERPLK